MDVHDSRSRRRTSRRRSFIGITAHWINRNLTRRSACLAVRVVGKCDYDVIAKLLESVYEEFDILQRKQLSEGISFIWVHLQV